ncbi:UDP-glucose dehydrogenase family protein [Cohnella kolymensis]|uniref:UDP-glucose dehydrogenase family protein n=1 Tax=Cohnella kolymensis TaxID=1590652 RepID=UPI002E154BB0
MRLAVIGAGYVGMTTAACFAEAGHQVVCVDADTDRVNRLRSGDIPFYEPGLQELVEKTAQLGRLSFTSDTPQAAGQSDVIFLTVGTPLRADQSPDLSFLEAAAAEAAQGIRKSGDYKIVAIKSTVPVGTTERLAGTMRDLAGAACDIVSVPEFLREGSAIRDTLHPDRVIIGTDSDRAWNILTELYRGFAGNVVRTDRTSAEMIKYASNAFLATKISFINEIANLCEKMGADIGQVAYGMGLDHRIGHSSLQAGIGFGGSCLPKDTTALIGSAREAGADLRILQAVDEVNRGQPYRILDKLSSALGSLEGKVAGVWGLSYKPDTDDIREAAAHTIIQELLRAGSVVQAYDPAAVQAMKAAMPGSSVKWCGTAAEAAAGADALCLLTEWDEFRSYPLTELAQIMKQPILVDGRNVFDQSEVRMPDCVIIRSDVRSADSERKEARECEHCNNRRRRLYRISSVTSPAAQRLYRRRCR